MAISHFTKLFGVSDAGIYVLSADPAGGSPTYGSKIDVPGVKSLQLSGTIDTKELRGDHQLLDSESVLRNVTGTLNFAKASLDLIAAAFGESVTDAGSGSTETATVELMGDSAPAFFKIEAKAYSTDLVGGSANLTLYKCKPAGLPFAGLAEEDYQTIAFPFSTTPLISTNKWIGIVLNETAAALSS